VSPPAGGPEGAHRHWSHRGEYRPLQGPLRRGVAISLIYLKYNEHKAQIEERANSLTTLRFAHEGPPRVPLAATPTVMGPTLVPETFIFDCWLTSFRSLEAG